MAQPISDDLRSRILEAYEAGAGSLRALAAQFRVSWGIRVLKPQDFDLREIFRYINETALFKNQWQLKTASQEDYPRLVETKYRPVLQDLEEEVIAAGWFEPKVVYGYFGAQGEGNDVIVYNLPEGWKQGDAIP